jgi:hypothetical protein
MNTTLNVEPELDSIATAKKQMQVLSKAKDGFTLDETYMDVFDLAHSIWLAAINKTEGKPKYEPGSWASESEYLESFERSKAGATAQCSRLFIKLSFD